MYAAHWWRLLYSQGKKENNNINKIKLDVCFGFHIYTPTPLYRVYVYIVRALCTGCVVKIYSQYIYIYNVVYKKKG